MKKSEKLLVIDASTHALCVALHDGKSAKVYRGSSSSRSEYVFEVLGRMRADRSTLKGLTGIAVGIGPGSFTGCRIAVAAAKTFAYALSTDLYPIYSSEFVAADVGDLTRNICVISDAKRNNLYISFHQPDGSLIEKPSLIHTGEFLGSIRKDCLYTGDGVAVLRDPIVRQAGMGAIVRNRTKWYPRPETMIRYATQTVKKLKPTDPLKVLPAYVYEETCNIVLKK